MSAQPAPSSPSTTARTAKVVSCPACGASLTLRALGQSVMAVCPSCRSQLDVSRPDIRAIKKYHQAATRLRIPLGTRGILKGQMFEVIGAMQRSVHGFRWEEYLLFNPYIGFRWLVYSARHWNFGTMLKEHPPLSAGGKLAWRGRKYAKFDWGNPVVDWVIGEFYWRVAVGEQVNASDFIAPPLMLSLEKSKGELIWTQLEYLEAAEVEAAFHVSTPPPDSVAPNQPNPSSRALRTVLPVALLALVLAIAFQVVTARRALSYAVLDGTYSFSQPEQVYGPFTFDAPFSLNELQASAPLRNSWVELDCALVNTVTGETFQFTNAFSFYQGTDSDGPWSEGSTHDTSTIGNIPAGTYNLVVEGASGDERDQRIEQSAQLRLTHDVVPWRNFWFTVLAIIAYPLYLGIRSHLFERERWSQSDFNPYSSE